MHNTFAHVILLAWVTSTCLQWRNANYFYAPYADSAALQLLEPEQVSCGGLNTLCLIQSHWSGSRFASRLADAHNAEHLGKFEELLEAAIDLDRIPDEYLIAASYDPQLEARLPAGRS